MKPSGGQPPIRDAVTGLRFPAATRTDAREKRKGRRRPYSSGSSTVKTVPDADVEK